MVGCRGVRSRVVGKGSGGRCRVRLGEVDSEKIETLSGGGESHSALILLYRAVELPKVSETEESA